MRSGGRTSPGCGWGSRRAVHRGDISAYVLSPFKRKDRRHVAHVIELATDATRALSKRVSIRR